MYRRFTTLHYIIFGLIAVGIISAFIDNPGRMIIPLLVFGLVFYFLKFPPKRLRRNKYASAASKPKEKRKKPSFRVIRGNKDDDDDTPKYH